MRRDKFASLARDLGAYLGPPPWEVVFGQKSTISGILPILAPNPPKRSHIGSFWPGFDTFWPKSPQNPPKTQRSGHPPTKRAKKSRYVAIFSPGPSDSAAPQGRRAARFVLLDASFLSLFGWVFGGFWLLAYSFDQKRLKKVKIHFIHFLKLFDQKLYAVGIQCPGSEPKIAR